MVHALAVIKKWGNSFGIVIPKSAVKDLGLSEGAKVDVDLLLKKKIDAFGMSRGASRFERDNDDREF